jgi:tryptophan synthase alpha chain
VSRIESAIRAGKANKSIALAAYLTVGYPDVATSVDAAGAVANSGADVIELGVPFSDPLADGVTIQRAGHHALGQGVTLATCLEAARAVTDQTTAPCALMGYYNPFLRYGLERFADDAARAGAAGVIVPDLPPDEAEQLRRACSARGIDVVFLLSPNSPEDRVGAVSAASSGFVYCTSLTGVTGARASLGTGVAPLVERVRRHTRLPVCVGFGISTPAHVAALTGIADGAIVGSALVSRIEAAVASGSSPEAEAAAFVASLRRQPVG